MRKYREFLQQPMQQALVLLWLSGLSILALRLAEGLVTLTWSASAALGAVLGLLLAGELRRALLVPISVLLGLASVLALVAHLGPAASNWPLLVAPGYALGLWYVTARVLRRTATSRWTARLGFAGGWGEGGGRAWVERMLYRTTLALVLLAVLAALAVQFGGVAPPAYAAATTLLGLVVAVAYLGLTGRWYRSRRNSYLLLAAAVAALIVLYRMATGRPGGMALLADPGLELLLVLAAAGCWVIAQWLETWTGRGRTDLTESLYRRPLRVAALALVAVSLLPLFLFYPDWLGPERGMDSVALLFAGGLVLLLANHALGYVLPRLAGIALVALGILRFQAVWLHGDVPFDLRLHEAVASDQWLTLALAAWMLATLASYLERRQDALAAYARPAYLVSLAGFGWAVLGALAAFATMPVAGNAFMPWVFLVLGVTLVSLTTRQRGLPAAAAGLGSGLILSLAAASFLALSGAGTWDPTAAIVWGFVLWLAGAFVLPRFNNRWPTRRVQRPDTWPWLGLVLVLAGCTQALLVTPHPGIYLAALAAYLLLMQRFSAWDGFRWIAVPALVLAGLAVGASSLAVLPSLEGLTVGNVLWVNGLLLAVPLWRRHGEALSLWLGWAPSDLATPLQVTVLAVLGWWLAYPLLTAIGVVLAGAPGLDSGPAMQLVVMSALLTASAAHAFSLQPSLWRAQILLVTVLVTFAALWLATSGSALHPSLFLAAWSAFLLAAQWPTLLQRWITSRAPHLAGALRIWLYFSALAAAGSLLYLPDGTSADYLMAIALMSFVSGSLGWRWARTGWVKLAAVLLVVFIHLEWLLWVDEVTLLLPWYALLSSLVATLAAVSGDALYRWQARYETPDADGWHAGSRLLGELTPWLTQTLPLFLAGLALVETVLHGFFLVAAIGRGDDPRWLFGGMDIAATLAALALLAVEGMRMTRRSGQEGWVYGVAGVLGAMGLYVRLLWLGLSPIGVWDTAALLAAGLAAVVAQGFTRLRAVYRIALLLPLLAVLSTPLQWASPYAGGALVSAAVLYLLLRQSTGNPLPLYLGAIVLNAAVYLWVPTWSGQFHLLQLYVIPAALSVLALLHLHRQELRPSVLQGARLAALSILYAGVTLDVFIRPELVVFVAALALSLLGIAVGVALRIRAFLYAGVAFLVLNVLGQLLQLYPEQLLGRAIVLMVVGTLVTGCMIWFSIKREAILQRIRIVRADLETWD